MDRESFGNEQRNLQVSDRIVWRGLDKDAYFDYLRIFITKAWRTSNNLLDNPFGSEFGREIMEASGGKFVREAQLAACESFPQGGYDRSFIRASWGEKEKMLEGEVEFVVGALMKLRELVEGMGDQYWEKSDDSLFKEMKTAVFGTMENGEILDRVPAKQLRNITRGMTILIHDREILVKVREELALDPEKELKRLLGGELSDQYQYDFGPLGMVVYLRDGDYEKYAGKDSSGSTFPYSLAGEMKSKIALVRWSVGVDINDERIAKTRRHEESHLFYDTFLRRTDLIWSDKLIVEKVKKATSDLEKHRQLSSEIVARMVDFACSEVLAYGQGSDDDAEVNVAKWGERFWDEILKKIDDSLEGREDMREVRKIYFDGYGEYLRKLRKMRWMYFEIMKMVKNDGSGEIDQEKAMAFLYSTDSDKWSRFARLIGGDPRLLARSFRSEMETMVGEMKTGLDKVERQISGRLFGRRIVKVLEPVQWLTWNENFELNRYYMLKRYYPEGGEEVLLEIAEKSNHHILVGQCVEGLVWMMLASREIKWDQYKRLVKVVEKVRRSQKKEFVELSPKLESQIVKLGWHFRARQG